MLYYTWRSVRNQLGIEAKWGSVQQNIVFSDIFNLSNFNYYDIN